jgi:ribose transport system permease protein
MVYNTETILNITSKIKRLSRKLTGITGSLIGLLGLCIILSILTPYFLTVSNILNVIRQSSMIAIIGAGMTFVVIAGGIDLSVGSVLALSSVVASYCMVNLNYSMYLAMIIGLLVGVIFGAINGFMITVIGLAPFIVTLAMMSIARGLSLVITGGRPIFGLPEAFEFFGGGYISYFPTPIIIMLIVYLLATIFLNNTKLGIYSYAIGGNKETALFSGINVKKYLLLIYSISGFTSALAGLLLASRLSSAQPLAGLGYDLDVIAATVIGGTSLSGGEGNMLGTLIGALIMCVLRNGLNLLNISSYWQQVTIGLVISLAVAMDLIRKKRIEGRS